MIYSLLILTIIYLIYKVKQISGRLKESKTEGEYYRTLSEMNEHKAEYWEQKYWEEREEKVK